MGRPTKIEIDNWIYLEFFDHIQNYSKPLLVSMTGRVIELNKESMVIAVWYPISKDKELVKNNLEIYTIIRSTIQKVKKLRV